jgi:hypothetical protein
MNDLIDRFEDKVSPEPNSGCWIWTGALDVNGYARIAFNGRNSKASRVAYTLFKCEDPGALHVLHRCDMPAWVNPDHLFLGTHQENMDDRAKKGRHGDISGTKNGNYGSRNWLSKLQADQVRQIRVLKKTMTYRQVADRFCVSIGSVQKIIEGRNWGWLK